jgi:hypothetical protein
MPFNPYQKRDVPATTLRSAASLLSLTPPIITPMKRSHPTLHGAPSTVQSNKYPSQANVLVTPSPSSAQTNTFSFDPAISTTIYRPCLSTMNKYSSL